MRILKSHQGGNKCDSSSNTAIIGEATTFILCFCEQNVVPKTFVQLSRSSPPCHESVAEATLPVPGDTRARLLLHWYLVIAKKGWTSEKVSVKVHSLKAVKRILAALNRGLIGGTSQWHHISVTADSNDEVLHLFQSFKLCPSPAFEIACTVLFLPEIRWPFHSNCLTKKKKKMVSSHLDYKKGRWFRPLLHLNPNKSVRQIPPSRTAAPELQRAGARRHNTWDIHATVRGGKWGRLKAAHNGGGKFRTV